MEEDWRHEFMLLTSQVKTNKVIHKMAPGTTGWTLENQLNAIHHVNILQEESI
jgi:hypothetical protein